MAQQDETPYFPSNQILLVSSVLSDAGLNQPDNEDYAIAFLPNDPAVLRASGCLFIVADGVGGRTHGEEASRYAAERVLSGFYELDHFAPEDRLRIIMQEVGNDLYYQSAVDEAARGATTLVAASVLENELTIANVGDSRAYLIHDGQAQQITRDHNQLSELLNMGTLSVQEIEIASGQDRLTRSLGGQPDVEVDIFTDIPLFPGDILLLCSDGLTRYISDNELVIQTEVGTPEQICRRLVDWANRSGGEDNITVLIVECQVSQSSLPGPILQEAMPVDADFIPIPQDQPAGRGHWFSLPPDRKRLILLASLFGGLLFLALSGWLLFGNLGRAAPSEQTVATATINPAQVLPAEVTPPVSVATMQSAETPGAVTPGTNPSPNSQVTGSTCIWPVEIGQTLYSIIRGFELTYSADAEYFFFETCDLEQAICSGAPLPIDSHANIYAGWNIIIPVTGVEACQAGEGVWVSAGE